MKRLFAWVLAIVLIHSTITAQVSLTALLTENLTSPISVDAAAPRFSWQLQSDKRKVLQTAYECKVMQGKKVVWASGKVYSSQSVMVHYAGAPLQSGTAYEWMVRVWDNSGAVSPWAKATFHTGMLNPNDWKAQWIEAGFAEDSINRPAQYFRHGFALRKKIQSAYAYITAHGMYEAQLNGQRIGDAYLTPGWTSYNHRLQYQVYDVTSMLRNGNNAVGVAIGMGWYRGYLAWNDNKNIYGKKTGVLFQLNIVYSDGSTETVISDGSWKSSYGPVRYAEIYNGETYDARKEQSGWADAGFNDASWSAVKMGAPDPAPLIATQNEPIKKHETFKPIKIFTTPKGELVADFGQNLVGWVQLKVKGNSGDSIKIFHAEVLTKEGNFYTDNLRVAKEENIYILKSGAAESFEPHFTFQGFRYIKIEGFPGTLQADNITAVALYSDMKPTGTFTTSNPLINQLQHNIQWGQRGNFLDVPTDCPQRDERLGWTGDAQVFSRTATFNFNVNNFFAKWMKDVAADQQPSGSVPFVIPNVLGPNSGGSTGWADVSTIIPWNVYTAYGDTQILVNQYNSMKAWVGYMEKNSKNHLWNTGFHFGDWLFYRPFDDNDGRSAVTDKYYIAQCLFAWSTQMVLNTAKVLQKTDDITYYTQLLQQVKDAFLKEYVTPNGRLLSSTQTAYVLALHFDMLPENLRQPTADRLVENVKSYGNHLTTGFLGTPYLCHVLSRFGHDDIAYKLLLQETYPSWLYPVKMGATTIWERWDGIKPDGSFEVPSMNSFNHYSYGAIGDWMYRVMAGLDTYDDGPGYKHIKIQPHIGGGFTKASATLQTYYGAVTSSWLITDGKLAMDVTIPANATATIFIPSAAASAITESGTALTASKDCKVMGTENGYVIVEVGSGTYHFETPKN
ncbi:MAG: family 78 glycoside hydrolase catalytic domain [Bacteroidetes bacterium]|nr:family 78 glycoside hydrolase catalytic domain [Bacteroidota bacterium]